MKITTIPHPVDGTAVVLKSCPCGKIAMSYDSIRAKFGYDKARRDGFAVYCRECRKRRKS